MKIGVITYHKELSQGATFQAYATYRALKELGCEVEVIDLEHKNKSPRPQWQVLLLDIYLSLSYFRQWRFRCKFYPPYSRHYRGLEDLRKTPPSIDAACVGSDQTWNIKIATKQNMPAYFLDFGPVDMPRFSYASSFGYSKWQIEEQEETLRIGEILRRYIGLSIREKTGQQILKETFGIDSSIVCDPTILHSNYSEFTKGLKQKNEVVCYSLAVSSGPRIKALKDISAFVGAPMRWVGKPFYVKGTKYTYFPDVYKWFRIIASSKFVLTDSFHGTVASILCHKPFVVLYDDNGLSSRILDLLTTLGLQDRLFFNYEDFAKSDCWKKDINYENVEIKLSSLRNASWEYLSSVLNKLKK